MLWPFNRKKWEKLGIETDGVWASTILNNWLRPDETIDIADRDYQAVPFKEYMWLRSFKPRPLPYLSEIWDCDNFAYACMVDINRAWAERSRGKRAILQGYIKGLIKKDGVNVVHAWNWHIDDKGIGRFIEPQTDEEFTGVEFTYAVRA